MWLCRCLKSLPLRTSNLLAYFVTNYKQTHSNDESLAPNESEDPFTFPHPDRHRPLSGPLPVDREVRLVVESALAPLTPRACFPLFHQVVQHLPLKPLEEPFSVVRRLAETEHTRQRAASNPQSHHPQTAIS